MHQSEFLAISYKWFSSDVIAAIFVHRTKQKTLDRLEIWLYYYANHWPSLAIVLCTTVAVLARYWKPPITFLKAEKIAFDFASHWLKNWCESFKPINKLSNRFRVISFDSHLKTAISVQKNCVIRIKFRRSLILGSKITKELKNKGVINICWCQNVIYFNNVNNNNSNNNNNYYMALCLL